MLKIRVVMGGRDIEVEMNFDTDNHDKASELIKECIDKLKLLNKN